MHIIRTAQVTRARVAGTQRQTKFQPITSAETREGQGEAEDDEGRKDAPSVPPSTALARKTKRGGMRRSKKMVAVHLLATQRFVCR